MDDKHPSGRMEGGQPPRSNGTGPTSSNNCSSTSNNNPRRHQMPFKVSLRDVQAASPAETDEEVSIMESIERSDPTGQSMVDMDHAVPLPPDLVVEDTTNEAYDDNIVGGEKLRTSSTKESSPERSVRAGTQPISTRGLTSTGLEKSYKIAEADVESEDIFTEDDTNSNDQTLDDALFQCTKALNKAHYEDVIASHDAAAANTGTVPRKCEIPPPPGRIYRKNAGLMSQADMFAANAGRLLKKRPMVLKRSDDGPRKISVKVSRGDLEIGMDDSEQSGGSDDDAHRHRRRRKNNKAQQLLHRGSREALDEIQELNSILQTQRSYLNSYVRTAMFFFILPSTIVAAVLFYGFGNPISRLYESSNKFASSDGTAVDGETEDQKEESPASYSWWILFIGVRQVITFSLATGVQYLIGVRCEGVRHSWFSNGPLVRLFLLQARRVPLQLVMWTLFNFMMLYGNGRFANHWMFYQEHIDLFNANNPSGAITSDARYRGLNSFVLVSGLAVATKRFLVGLHFGKTTYIKYAERLSAVLRMVVEVTNVSRLTDMSGNKDSLLSAASIIGHNTKAIDGWLSEVMASDDDEAAAGTKKADGDDETNDSDDDNIVQRDGIKLPKQELLVDPSRRRGNSSFSMSDSQKTKIDQLLGEWEEPDLQSAKVENPTLGSIVQFRASLGVLDSSFPFSQSFGVAENRLQVIECAQRVYCDLLEMQGNKIQSTFSDSPLLKFHTIALVAKNSRDGTFDKKKIRSLVKVFRPQRDGDISLVDFCKSVDSVYKEMRLLRANIANEGKMNAGSEHFLNLAFYFVLAWIGLAVIGVNPGALFGLCLSFLISISFMVGGAASDYVKGLLFILVQQPYDIGDRINVAGVQTASCTTGSPGWIVKDVSLIINMARSPKATMNFLIQFGIDVPASSIEEFKNEMIEYIKSKPREWLALNSFRMSSQMAELGYAEYKMTIQHRESWQNVAAIQNSLADVQQKALNLSKEKGMGYKSPALPVEMTVMKSPLLPETLGNIVGGT